MNIIVKYNLVLTTNCLELEVNVFDIDCNGTMVHCHKY